MTLLEEYDAAPVAARTRLVQTWIRTDWRRFFRELRESRPVLVTPKPVLVARHDDVVEVLSRDDVFSVRPYRSRMDPVTEGGYMLARDGAVENWRDRGVMQAVLSPDDLPGVRALAGRLADAELDRAEKRGHLDAVPDLGRRVPIRVCGDYFGFPGPDEATMARWSKATQTDMFKNPGLDPAVHAASVQAGAEMRGYLAGLVRERRRGAAGAPAAGPSAATDVLGRLLRLSLPDELGFDDGRVVTNVLGLLVGTVETTSQAVVQVLAQLLGRDEVRDAATRAASDDDPAAVEPWVWEALRHDPVNPLLPRWAEHDHVLAAGTDRETLVRGGTLVLACTASALHDERVVPEPDAFRTDRPHPTRLHFGLGAHTCLGRHLGEQVVPEVVRRVLRRPGVHRLPGTQGVVDFAGGPFPEHLLLGFRGPRAGRRSAQGSPDPGAVPREEVGRQRAQS